MLIRAALIVGTWYWTDEWVAGVAVAVLLLVWELLTPDEGPPVLALALTYQWMQVTIGIFYTALTGVQMDAMLDSNWRPMVLIGLGCVTCFTVSLWYGIRVAQRQNWTIPAGAPRIAFSGNLLYAAYGSSLLLTGVIQEIAWQYPSFTQAIIAITYSHLALVFLLARRFTNPEFQWRKLAILMGIEVGLGFTGYFAGFREPLLMAAIAVFEIFDRRDVRFWAFGAVLLFVLSMSSLVWISVRGQLRQEMDDEIVTATRVERFDRARTLSTGVLSQNAGSYSGSVTVLIDRLWAIYYPALALQRVPLVVPHTDGQIMRDALTHLISPRFLYPDKADLISDSEMVRKYAGLYVAGEQQNTSIAFGYAAEAYVDYGLPWMFIPILIFGFLLGMCYKIWLSIISHRELAIALTTVMFWLILYIFERSWVKTLGLTVTVFVYLGGLTYLLDQFLLMRRAQNAATAMADRLLDATR